MYYAQGFYCALFDNPLFSDPISAWVHGPVVEGLYHDFKQYGRGSIPLPVDFDKNSLNSDEFGLIKEVFDEFGQYSAWKLRDMTHEESPWLNHENEAGVISLDEITDYFKTRIN